MKKSLKIAAVYILIILLSVAIPVTAVFILPIVAAFFGFKAATYIVNKTDKKAAPEKPTYNFMETLNKDFK